MSEITLANAELAIMDFLWDREQVTARDILDALYADSSRSQHGTVQRLLQRLEKKGYVERDRSEFVHRFRACISREEHAGRQIESLASRLMSGSIAPLITHLVESHRLSPEDIEKLRAVLDQSEEEGGDND